MEPIKWKGGPATHHVLGAYHYAHAGSCDSDSLPSHDHEWRIQLEGEDGRCNWCRAADENRERLLAEFQ
jgi:hypothetical protein